MAPLWQQGEYLIATQFGPQREFGFTYRNLGLQKTMRGSPKGRRPPTWTLTYLGSGHRVCDITAHIEAAFNIATEISECSDWSFDGLEGYLNIDPDLKDKVREIGAKYPKQVRVGNRSGNQSKDVARQIAELRA